MVRNQCLRAYEFRGFHALADRHRIWLIYREEGEVDIAKFRHLPYRLGVPCYIYPESIEIKDISIAITLRVEYFPACGGVICGDNKVADSSGQFSGIAIGENATSSQGCNRFRVAIQQGLLR